MWWLALHPHSFVVSVPTTTNDAMTRIIAGAARGRRLAVPGGTRTRPTSDRAREGLFATVTAVHGPLAGAGVLDLYAGSGAIGLEALSRGAARVIRANIAAVGLPGARLVAGRVTTVLGRGPLAGAPFDVVLADPPYAAGEEEITQMLTALQAGGWLASGALVAVERASRSGPVAWSAGYAPDRSRRYGEATFWYGLAAGT